MLKDRGPFRRVALKSYISQMSKPNPKGLFDSTVAEILEQQGFVWEESPRSVYDPQQLYTALCRYATDWSQFEGMDASMRSGFRKAYQIFARPKNMEPLSVLSSDIEVTGALKLSKSSGLPLMTSKKDSLTYSFDRECQILKGVKAPNPCVAYKRTQKNNKTRLVWGYPLEMTIMESRFARPLIERFIDSRTPMAFGMTKCELGAHIHRNFVDSQGTTVCLDYSKFDSTISATMVKQAFRILSTWFKKEDLERYGWDVIVRYFISTPIVMPDGHLYTGKNHGVPSGSYFTQMIDSVVNVAMMYALKYEFNLSFNDRALYVLGDDVIVQVKSDIDLRSWAKYLARHGLILHDDEKTIVGEAHFLGAFWNKGKPDVPIQELVNKACFPEQFRDYSGQLNTGAKNVLRSYASSYISGFRLLPQNLANMRWVDFPYDVNEVQSKYMSGSDKYLFEEKSVGDRGSSSEPVPTLSYRIML